jgi:hypothetical protein
MEQPEIHSDYFIKNRVQSLQVCNDNGHGKFSAVCTKGLGFNCLSLTHIASMCLLTLLLAVLIKLKLCKDDDHHDKSNLLDTQIAR